MWAFLALLTIENEKEIFKWSACKLWSRLEAEKKAGMTLLTQANYFEEKKHKKLCVEELNPSLKKLEPLIKVQGIRKAASQKFCM